MRCSCDTIDVCRRLDGGGRRAHGSGEARDWRGDRRRSEGGKGGALIAC